MQNLQKHMQKSILVINTKLNKKYTIFLLNSTTFVVIILLTRNNLNILPFGKGAIHMSTNTIITIERQYGSGGHLIGEKLSKDLGIPFYDSELIKVAAKESGICEEIFESFDEKPTTSFLYSLVMDPYSLGYNSNSFDLPLNHKVFLAAFDTIKELAKKRTLRICWKMCRLCTGRF